MQASKLAIVTGASRGIGAAVAREMAEQGFAVLLIARNAEALNRVANYLQAEGGQVYTLSGDMTKETDIARVEQFVTRFAGDLSVLVHNAGISRVGPIRDFAPEDWRRIIEVNLTAPFLLTRALLRHMNRGSQIVFINSVAGKQAFPEWGAYNASKQGLRALADTLRQEAADTGIRVTSIFPAAVDTPLHDKLNLGWDRKQMMQPLDIARAVMYCVRQPSNIRINELDLSNMAGTF